VARRRTQENSNKALNVSRSCGVVCQEKTAGGWFEGLFHARASRAHLENRCGPISDPQVKRCEEKNLLDFDYSLSWGGVSTSTAMVQLLPC